MISMAPNPLYLPAEEIFIAARSPIFQRKDVKYNNKESTLKVEPNTTTTTTIKSPTNSKSLKKSGSPYLSSQVDKSQEKLIELSGKRLTTTTSPKLCSEGVGGGVYFIQGDRDTHPISVFKPMDEENGIIQNNSMVGLKAGVLPGEGAFKEVAVYLFDQIHKGYFRVPVTTLVEVQHPLWAEDGQTNQSETSAGPNNNTTAASQSQQYKKKIGSLQEYIVYEDTAEEVGCSKFSISDIHRIGLLDSLILNCDRHSGNLLVVSKEEDLSSLSPTADNGSNGSLVELIPIDHSLSLPSSDQLSDAWFDWINFPQSKVPFTAEEIQFIRSIDIDQVIYSLHVKLPKLRIACLETLKLTTLFVKKAVDAGLNLNQIGTFISRYQSLDEPSSLEKVVAATLSNNKNLKLSLSNSQFWVCYEHELNRSISLI